VYRVRAALRVLPRLRWSDVRELVEAQLALLSAQFLLRRRPVGELIAGAKKHAPRRPLTTREGADAIRTARAVQRAALYGVFQPTCLVRALALHRLLERHGITGSAIRIGVRWVDGAFAAHAWVERDGAILGDTAARTAAFSELVDVRFYGTTTPTPRLDTP
jgi:Transglutaminase-like superfamily